MVGLAGSLATMPLHDIVSFLASRKLSGHLRCSHGDVHVSLCFHDGIAVAAHDGEHEATGRLPAHCPDALARLLAWVDGQFIFSPATLQTPTDTQVSILPAIEPAPQASRVERDFAATFCVEVKKRLAARGRGKRFPRDLRRRAVVYYWARIHEGSFLSEVSRELGLPPPTLRRWVLDMPAASSSATTDHVTPAANGRWSRDPHQPVLVGPGGLRVEGLSVNTLVELLRRLESGKETEPAGV